MKAKKTVHGLKILDVLCRRVEQIKYMQLFSLMGIDAFLSQKSQPRVNQVLYRYMYNALSIPHAPFSKIPDFVHVFNALFILFFPIEMRTTSTLQLMTYETTHIRS